MQIGIDSFAAAYDDTSLAVNPSDRLRNLVEQIEHADQVGLDAFGIGEHHRRELSFADMAGSWRDSTIVRSRRRAWSSFNGRNHRR
jgi:alkanesulfonate monooxygenase SsuD/methylene tetrahydromethanopterin reductase-like flavin-dependent oxidoreductase (luciferase family)